MLFRLLPDFLGYQHLWERMKAGMLAKSWKSRVGYFTQCSGSVGPSGARDVQASAVRLDHLRLDTSKLSKMQISKELLDLAGC